MVRRVGKGTQVRYTVCLLSKMLYQLTRPHYGLLAGCLLGLLWVGSSKRLVQAQATLFFPPPLVLSTSSAPANAQQGSKTEPTAWAESMLLSKDAADAVCKRIERSQAENKDQALRSACLLSEGRRVSVATLPNSCVRLKVWADDPAIAISLTEGLLAYLNFKAKIPLEDPDRDRLSTAEKLLRSQERSLANLLWERLAFDSVKTSTPGQSLELDLMDYQCLVTQYRQFMHDSFFRETHQAAGGPSFSVVEPPFVVCTPSPWWRGALLGGLFGLLASAILQWTQPGNRQKNVRWRSQEGAPLKRTGPADFNRQRTKNG